MCIRDSLYSDPAGYRPAGVLRTQRARAGLGGEDCQRHLGAYSDALLCRPRRDGGAGADVAWRPCADGAPAAGTDGRRRGAERIWRAAAAHRDKIKAHAAACDNIAVFFGEDIFIAFGAVLLIDAFLKENGIEGIEPLHIGLWAIPTAIAALVIHMTRLLRLDASIRRDVMAWRAEQGMQEIAQ